MKPISILEEEDKVLPTDWCRPLMLITMSGGHSDYYSFESIYSGAPENNVLWVPVSEVFGECWYNYTVKEIHIAVKLKYEFVRGDIPLTHQYGLTKKQKAEAEKKKLQETISFGKYKAKLSFYEIYHKDPSYYDWLHMQGLLPK